MPMQLKGETVPTPSEFSKLAFDMEPFDFQTEFLDDMNDRLVVVCGRRVGKTTMSAIRGLWQAIFNPGSEVLVLAPNQRQASNLFRMMKQMISRCTTQNRWFQIEKMIDRETQTIIEFSNGSIIYSLPVSQDGDNIRGLNSTFTIVDEAADIKEEAWKVITPMLMTSKGTLWMIGTPKGVNNRFYREYKRNRDRKKDAYKVYRFPSSVSPLIDDADMKREKEGMIHDEYIQEYLAEFVEEADSYFPEHLVRGCVDEDAGRANPIPFCKYYLGFDPSMGGDEAVGVVIEETGVPKGSHIKPRAKYKVVDWFEMRKNRMDEQIMEVKKWHGKWNFNKIFVDETGMGVGFVEDMKKIGLPVEGLKMSIKSKQDTFNNLKLLMEQGDILLPDNQKMINQLCSHKYDRQTGTGYIRIYHPAKTGHDDYATALVLAAWAGRKGKKPTRVVGAAKSLFGK